MTFTESTIDQAAIDWLQDLGEADLTGPRMARDGQVSARGKGHGRGWSRGNLSGLSG